LHSTSLNESIKSFKSHSKPIIENQNLTESVKEDESSKSILRNKKLSRNLNYKSLIELRENVEKNTNKCLKKIIQDMFFVGCLDRELALIQHQTGLYILNTNLLCQELFYQIAIFNFGNFGYLKLEKPIRIYDLAFMALNDPVNKLKLNT
jgi:DNA mismatch repair protein MLH1